MELCLGTVQFGMDYGVFNTPKKDMEYCIKCIDYATQNGITALDTATAYGNAEEVVGNFLRKKTIERDRLWISTKLLPNILDDYNEKQYESVILENLKKSLTILGTDYVDVYFLHSSRYAFRPEILESLRCVQKAGLAKHIGVSVYDPEEALACYNNDAVDYIQAPYSIFDHRMKEKGIFNPEIKKKCSVDTRTAFIKGLIRLNENEVPEHLAKARPILKKMDDICKATGFTRIELALGYIKREKEINHLVFGIRDMEQLKEDMLAFERVIPAEIFDALEKEFAGIAADIVVPSLWKK